MVLWLSFMCVLQTIIHKSNQMQDCSAELASTIIVLLYGIIMMSVCDHNCDHICSAAPLRVNLLCWSSANTSFLLIFREQICSANSLRAHLLYWYSASTSALLILCEHICSADPLQFAALLIFWEHNWSQGLLIARLLIARLCPLIIGLTLDRINVFVVKLLLCSRNLVCTCDVSFFVASREFMSTS